MKPTTFISVLLLAYSLWTIQVLAQTPFLRTHDLENSDRGSFVQQEAFGQTQHLTTIKDGGLAATGSIDVSAQPSDIFLSPTGLDSQLNIDLELEVVSSYLPFKQYQEARFVAILVNRGNTLATGIRVHFPRPDGGVFTGGNEYNSSQGTYQPYGNQIWEVGDLPVGDTVEIELNFFTLQADPPLTVYAQVLTANETDEDSTPGNGSPPTPNEDDEAVLFFGNEPVILGIDNNAPTVGASASEVRIFGLDPQGKLSTISTLPAPVTSNTTSFNGAAYDAVSGRFYFSRFDGPSQSGLLFSNDLAGNQQTVGQLTGAAACGTFYGGAYYYIAQMTDDLYRVDLNPDGSFLSETLVADIFAGTSYDGQGLGLGDIAFSLDGATIYGSATHQGANSTTVFFSLNADGTDYTEICSGPACGFQAGSTQIAFGTDARLYGANSLGNYEFYQINPTDGSAAEINRLDRSLSDLALGTATLVSPDLSLTNLILAASGLPGQVLSLNFDLNNIGNTLASGDYVITHYLSTDSVLSNDDEWVGEVATGNTPVGTISDLPAAISLPPAITPGNYFLITVADSENDIAEFSEDNNTVVAPLEIRPVVSGNNIDLELSLNGSPDFTVYQFYPTTVTITNRGNQPATGVRVQIPKPKGTVYAGGNEYETSQGIYRPYGDQVWEVGTLDPGASVSLDINLFVLQSNPFTIYAQVVAANEPDTDSQPGNGTPPTVNEDDEAALTPAASLIRSVADVPAEKDIPAGILTFQQLFPSPAIERVNIVVSVPKTGSYGVMIYDSRGVLQSRFKWYLSTGENQRFIDISHFPVGIYTIRFQSKNQHDPVRFIKTE